MIRALNKRVLARADLAALSEAQNREQQLVDRHENLNRPSPIELSSAQPAEKSLNGACLVSNRKLALGLQLIEVAVARGRIVREFLVGLWSVLARR